MLRSKINLRLFRVFTFDLALDSHFNMITRHIRTLLPWIACLTLVVGMLSGHAVADEKSDMDRLDKIQTLSDRDNALALKELIAFKEALPASTSYQVRVEVLKALVNLYYDAGKIKSSDATIAEFLQLAQSRHDQETIAIAQIADAYRLFDDGKINEAIAYIKRIQDSVPNTTNPELQMRLHNAFGVMYSTTGNFDIALKHYYQALGYADQLPRRRIQARLYKLDSIAKLYAAMKDPERALDITKQALSLAPIANTPKLRASMLLTQGIFYSQLQKHEESLAANEAALAISKEAGMPVLEATALINIADHFLLVHDYKQAESYARRGLALGEALGDKGTIEGAKINLGFALGGQGKVKEGVPYVMHAISFFKESDAKADAEATLGELSLMYERAGMYKEAVASLRQQQELSNEIFRSDRNVAVTTLQEQYAAEQRQRQIELLSKENALKDAQIRNQHLLQIITLLGTGLVVVASAFVFNLYRQIRRTNLQLREANTKLEVTSTRDPLTGLFNRRAFVDLMASRQPRDQDERRAANIDTLDGLILLDIDQFKKINDTYGHAVGDTVLKDISHRLKRIVRETDMVLRWGGEEFLIFSPKTHPEQITVLVDRILRAIGEQVFVDGDIKIPVTVTAGYITLPFADVPEQSCGWEKTLQIADMALYLAKAHGRNRAYGVAKLLVDHHIAMPILDHDLSAAKEAGMVELIEVIGPESTH